MDYRSFAPGKTSEAKIPKKVSVPVRHITPKLFSALLVILLIAGGAYGAMKWWENRQIAQNNVKPTPTPVEVPVDWKTYRNQEYGFEFRYPGEFFTKPGAGSGELYLLSKSSTFKYDEDAFIISVYVDQELSDGNDSPATKEINTDIISNSVQKKVTVTFSGDPPTGTYKVSIPLESEYLHFFTTIGQMDDPAYGGTNADLALFNQILSTFKFIDTAAGQFCGGIAALPCGSGYRCQLEGNYPDAGGVCVKE